MRCLMPWWEDSKRRHKIGHVLIWQCECRFESWLWGCKISWKGLSKTDKHIACLQVQRLPCEPRGVHQAYQHQGKYRICSFVRGFCGEKLKAIFFKKQTNNKIGLSVDFVLTVTSSMYGRDPTPILPPTQHLCMQPTSTTHSHPPNGMSANFKIVFPKYSPQSHQQGRSRLDGVPSVYHNLGALPK